MSVYMSYELGNDLWKESKETLYLASTETVMNKT